MPITAAIKFVQGLNVGAPGVALQGIAGAGVVASNGDDTGVDNWTYEWITLADGSILPPGVVQDGLTPTYSFLPDAGLTGGYLLRLTVRDAFGNIAVDERVFEIPETSGRRIPPFGATDKSYNIGAQTQGWAPDVDAYLKQVDAGGGGSGDIAFQDVGDADLDLTAPAFVAKIYEFAFHGIGAADRLALLPTNTGGNTVAAGTTLVFMDTDGTLGLPGGKTLTLNGGTRHIEGTDSPFVWTDANVGPFGAVWLTYVDDATGWKII